MHRVATYTGGNVVGKKYRPPNVTRVPSASPPFAYHLKPNNYV